MSLFTRGEKNCVRPTHPEGKINDCSGPEVADHWGDLPTEHQALRVGLLNIRTFPSTVMHHKNKSIFQMINDHHLDCLGMTEINTYWPSLSTQQQLQERTREWFDTTVSAEAYNYHNTRMCNQQGGAAIIAKHQLVHRSCKRKYDTLVRWMMMSFKEKKGLNLRVVSAYRQQTSTDPYTVY